MRRAKVIPYRMKIYTEFNLATWLNIRKFWYLNFNYMSYHWEISNNIIINAELKFSEFAISGIEKFKFQWKLSSCRVSSMFWSAWSLNFCFVYSAGTRTSDVSATAKTSQYTQPNNMMSNIKTSSTRFTLKSLGRPVLQPQVLVKRSR